MSWACAPAQRELESFFRANHAAFEPSLLTRNDHNFCHIYYRPTISGFEADPVTAPVSGLFFNIDTLSFLTDRAEEIGDSIDVARSILSRVGRPLAVTLNVGIGGHERQYDHALQFYFGSSPHNFARHLTAAGELDPWVQDFLKSGRSGGQRKILVSRRAFEGQPANGELLEPMIDSFQEPPFVRSKLSFEGGDLSFVRDPDGRLTMFYGASAQEYWGSALTRQEFEYVLRVEFGAARAVYAGGITPHIDYSLKLLPRAKIALVAEPVCGNQQVARAAMSVLLNAHPDRRDRLSPLAALLTSGPAALTERRGRILEIANGLSASHSEWKPRVNPAVQREIEDYVRHQCPGDPLRCLDAEHLPALLDAHPALLRDWVRIGAGVRVTELMGLRLLEVIRRQVAGCDDAVQLGFDNKARMLESMGYRVVRVPWLGGDGAPASPWPGISYVNAVDIDDMLFVPEIGLGDVEREWIDRLQQQLQGQYRVVPVRATRLLLDNGGIHCAVAVSRKAERTLQSAVTTPAPQ